MYPRNGKNYPVLMTSETKIQVLDPESSYHCFCFPFSISRQNIRTWRDEQI